MQRRLKTRTPKRPIWPMIPATLAGMIANVIMQTTPADNGFGLFIQKSGTFGIFVGLSTYWAIRTFFEHFDWAAGRIKYFEEEK